MKFRNRDVKKKKGKIQVMLNIRGLAEEAYNF